MGALRHGEISGTLHLNGPMDCDGTENSIFHCLSTNSTLADKGSRCQYGYDLHVACTGINYICMWRYMYSLYCERERERERKRERERERERDSSNYCLFASDNTEYYILLNQK